MNRGSKKTASTYSFALDHFNRFIERNYNSNNSNNNNNKYNIQTILEPLGKGKGEIDYIDVYDLLESFITYLQNDSINGHDLSSLSVKLYMAAVRSYLSYNDIEITPIKFKKKVKMPRVSREDELAIDAKDIRQILLSCNNRRLKAYLLVLASGGMRAVEALAIRNKDIDSTVKPTKVHIRKEFAKTRSARDIYISDEATQYLKQWIDFKYRNRHAENRNITNKIKDDDDLVFSKTAGKDPQGLYPKILVEFQKVLYLAGFKDRKDEGVYKRRKITFHSFRRFVKTTLSGSNDAGYDYSEWFLGHSTRSTYFQMKEEKRREIYTKYMKYFTYLDYSLLEAKGKDVESQLEERKQEIKQLKQRDKTNDEAIAKMQEQLTKLQDEVSLQYRMSLGWATETSHWSERLVEEMKKVEDISTMRDLKKWKEMRKEYLKKAEEEKSKSIESYLKKKK
jgi:integrase